MDSKYHLTEGALLTIMNGGDVPEPILQVLGSKRISSSTADKERYRLILSDGKYTISFALLPPQADDRIRAGVTQMHSIVKLKRYISNVIKNTAKGDMRVLLILDVSLMAHGEDVGQMIGTPSPIGDGGTPSQHSATNFTRNGLNNSTTTSIGAPNSVSETDKVLSPIASLNPFHNNWMIKARVTNKSSIRSWSNNRGEGKLFVVDLIDQSGEIRCTVFKDLVDKFFDTFEVDRVYFISKGLLKLANKQFCTLNCTFEMSLTNDSIVSENIGDNAGIPRIRYDFTSIDKVAAMEPGTLVDVIGVCATASDLQMFTSKSTNRELKKKELVLVDQSKTAISLVLWGLQAENFNSSDNPVVLIKGAKIAEFAGNKNLTCALSSQLKINPDITESHRLKGWYELEGHQVEIKNVSERGGAGSLNTPWMTFKEVQERGLGRSQRGDYYQTMGTVLLVRSDRMVYKACPIEECNKKIIDMENGMYRCEKCNREYPEFKYRLLASMNIADSSSNQWVTLFSSEAEKVLGRTAAEIGQAIEEDPDNAAKMVENIDFKQYVFKCRVKMEAWNDEERLKTIVVKVTPINYEEYNTHLMEKIKKFVPEFNN